MRRHKNVHWCMTHMANICVRDVRAVMHAGITNQRFPLKSLVGKTFPASTDTQFDVSGKRSMAATYHHVDSLTSYQGSIVSILGANISRVITRLSTIVWISSAALVLSVCHYRYRHTVHICVYGDLIVFFFFMEEPGRCGALNWSHCQSQKSAWRCLWYYYICHVNKVYDERHIKSSWCTKISRDFDRWLNIHLGLKIPVGAAPTTPSFSY